MARTKVRTDRKVPRGEKRRRELALVAERLFLRQGYTETTMQMIASEAGGSKETLYRHFASKEAMFAELISARAATIAGPQSALARDELPKTALFELGMSLMGLMAKSETSSLFNIVVAEVHRTPDLARIFYDRGPGTTLRRLMEYLRSATVRGQLNCRDPQRAAKLFLGAVISHHHLHCLIGKPSGRLSTAEMRNHVKAAVEMFLARFAA
ncbi:MAG TPA: TetR/AcrR family transcriptional regulator [Bradyrhizobium sp.]|jgi:AcrR family transcriptional regulator